MIPCSMISRAKGSSGVNSSGRKGSGDKSVLIAKVVFLILLRSFIRIPSNTSETNAISICSRKVRYYSLKFVVVRLVGTTLTHSIF